MYRFVLIALCVIIVESKLIYTKVAVLGAGAAGIASAKTLSLHNQSDFVIIDAQSFIGGRVQHAAFGHHQIELGANWIYGKGRNPIHRLAQQHGLKTTPNEKTNLAYFDQHGFIKNQTQGHLIYEEFEQVKVQLVNYAGKKTCYTLMNVNGELIPTQEKRMQRGQVDLSSRSALNLMDWTPTSPLEKAVEYFSIDWEFSEPPEMCSLEYATGTVDGGTYPLGNEFVVDDRGFNHILKEESRTFLEENDPRLMLNTLVTKVTYGDDQVIVHAGEHVIVADYAICTFSLGVLQSNGVEFEPPFPDWKREALSSFHMTTYTKIFLRFKTKFWQDWQFALYAAGNRGYYTVWQNLNAPGYLFKQTDHILMVTTTDNESKRIESMTTQQVQAEIMQVLRNMFGKDVQEPIDIVFPKWLENPLFRGSYSNWPIGASQKHHMNMRASLGRLWFAGEAMSADYYGYLHGAWLEGKAIGKSIYRCLADKCPPIEYYKYVTGCDEKPRFIKQRFNRQ